MTASIRARNEQEIMARRRATVSSYPASWSRMIREWRSPRGDDAVWLTYAASYLFNTHGTRWAVDPVLLPQRVPEAQPVAAGRDLDALDFALLTHTHADHVDVDLWAQLKESRCHWVVPEHMAGLFRDKVPSDATRYTVAVPGKPITLPGARVTPFDAPHSEKDAAGNVVIKVDSTGYLVETDRDSSYLFPCDIRAYDSVCLEQFAGVSVVFAHVFLGRSAALSPNPPLLDAFVRFYLRCRPKQIVLSHLYEFGRAPEDCWIGSHAAVAAKAFMAADKAVKVVTPDWYRETVL